MPDIDVASGMSETVTDSNVDNDNGHSSVFKSADFFFSILQSHFSKYKALYIFFRYVVGNWRTRRNLGWFMESAN